MHTLIKACHVAIQSVFAENKRKLPYCMHMAECLISDLRCEHHLTLYIHDKHRQYADRTGTLRETVMCWMPDMALQKD